MLVRLLSKSDKAILVACSELLSVSDDPLLWDGKAKENITSATNLDRLSFERNDLEVAWITELKNEKALDDVNDDYIPSFFSNIFVNDASSVESTLLEKLKESSLKNVETPEVRLQAATEVLKEILGKREIVNVSVMKLMLFELMLLALQDGCISGVEWALLKEFQRYYQLEDFIYDDLLERAESMNQEVTKTIAIILE